eukprot:scaffold3277_cov218-Pinguiococcus_pyrenoidosus.AAC.2
MDMKDLSEYRVSRSAAATRTQERQPRHPSPCLGAAIIHIRRRLPRQGPTAAYRSREEWDQHASAGQAEES